VSRPNHKGNQVSWEEASEQEVSRTTGSLRLIFLIYLMKRRKARPRDPLKRLILSNQQAIVSLTRPHLAGQTL
jgi:hypothetical protein